MSVDSDYISLASISLVPHKRMAVARVLFASDWLEGRKLDTNWFPVYFSNKPTLFTTHRLNIQVGLPESSLAYCTTLDDHQSLSIIEEVKEALSWIARDIGGYLRVEGSVCHLICKAGLLKRKQRS